MKKNTPLIIIFIFITLVSSCGLDQKSTSNTKTYVTCDFSKQASGECTRYMDRKIYFASNSSAPGKNEIYAIESVKKALTQLSMESYLGANYFSFDSIDEKLIEPITTKTEGVEWKSFIQILPSDEFNTLETSINSYLADPNVIVALNQANKKEFWIIIRSECFESNNVLCSSTLNEDGQTFTTEMGLRAMVARSIGRLVKMSIVDCGVYPTDTMCAEHPNDDQWLASNKNQFYAGLKNALEVIDNNPSFYDELRITP